MTTIIDGKVYMTTTEAARELRRHPGTLRNWHSDGTGPIEARKIGHNLFWPKGLVEHYRDHGK